MLEVRAPQELPYRYRSIENTWIPTRDGTRLAARIWLPELADEQPVPAVLEYIPYRKRDIKRTRDERIHGYFAGHGYASVRVDLRGSGDSEGVLRDEYLETELTDGEDILAWLASQVWCDGSVGMIGISWGGFNGLQIAARRPPALKAVISLSSSDDRYANDIHYMGGCLLNDNLSWASTMFAYNSMPPDPEIVGDQWRDLWHQRLEGSGLWLHKWLEHQVRDEYWRHASVGEDYSAIQCPVLAVSGWADGYTDPVFRLVENLGAPCQGLIGPWSHVYPHVASPGPQIGFLQECVRWWDQWLKGEETGVTQEPKLRVWMQHSVKPQTDYRVRPGRWVAEPEWPSPNIGQKRFQLAPGRILFGDDAPHREDPVTIQSPLSVGLFAGKWYSSVGAPDFPYDQREEDGGSLVFESPPLEEEMEILGQPVLEVTLSADQPVAMVAVRLSDMAPDDKCTRVTFGLFNLCHRNGHDRPEHLTPGEPFQVRIPLNHIAQSFPAGHRIRLGLSTSYWPLAWPPPRPVRLTVHPVDSALLLPVRPRRDDDDRALRPFGVPEGAEPSHRTIVKGPQYDWRIIRNLGPEESTLHVVNDDGIYRLEMGLEVEKRREEWYRFRGYDFGSLEGEVHGVRGLSRPGWSVRTETRTVLSSTAREFKIHATLDAFEGGRRIFTRIWNESVDRRFL